MIIFHLYRERFKSRKLFFIYGAEDMTLVNKSNSLLPVKRWSLNLPLRTFLQQLLYSCYQQWVSLTWITQVWGSCWPNPDRNQGVVLLKCKGETRESLRGPAEWHPHMDQSIVQVCKMHPHLKPFTFVGELFPLQVYSKCPFWGKAISCFQVSLAPDLICCYIV